MKSAVNYIVLICTKDTWLKKKKSESSVAVNIIQYKISLLVSVYWKHSYRFSPWVHFQGKKKKILYMELVLIGLDMIFDSVIHFSFHGN